VISGLAEFPSRSEIVVWSVPQSQTPILSPEIVLESILVCEIAGAGPRDEGNIPTSATTDMPVVSGENGTLVSPGGTKKGGYHPLLFSVLPLRLVLVMLSPNTFAWSTIPGRRLPSR